MKICRSHVSLFTFGLLKFANIHQSGIPTSNSRARGLVCVATRLVSQRTKNLVTVEAERLVCSHAHHVGDGFGLRANKATVESAVWFLFFMRFRNWSGLWSL